MPEAVQPQGKTPVDLLPKRLWVERRVQAIFAAMKHCCDDGVPVPREWVEEAEEWTTALILREHQREISQTALKPNSEVHQ